MIINIVFILLAFLIRIYDAIEHGYHWKSKPSKDYGKEFHTADLLQTWCIRIVYAISAYFLFGLTLAGGFFLIGLVLIDQSVWQMILNKIASGGWFIGEQDTAEFFGWFTSPKLFANHMRIFQFVMGVWFVVVSFYM